MFDSEDKSEMEYLMAALSAATALFAIGVAFYGYLLLGIFKGGELAKPFQILAPSAFLLAASETVAIVGGLLITEWVAEVIQITLRSLFLLSLFWGFYRFNRLWVARKKIDEE
jgi:hypothetical protein